LVELVTPLGEHILVDAYGLTGAIAVCRDFV